MKRTLLLLTSLLAVGCAQAGALEQAELSAACEPDDVVCASLGLDAPIAVGADLRLNVAASSPGVTTPTMHLESARPDVAVALDHAVQGVAPGMTALLISTKAGLVMDFVHLFVAAPTRLGVHRFDGAVATTEEIAGRIQLLSGDEIVLAPAPYRGEERLMGRSEATWSVDTTAVLLLEEGVLGRRRVVAREPGEASLTIFSFGLEHTVELEVLP